MLIVRATRKLLDLVGPPDIEPAYEDTTELGPWYATVLPWRPRVALLVSETTLLPILTPLTPAAGWPTRIATAVATVLDAHGVPISFIENEVRQMDDRRLATTASRSIVGVMNDYVSLAKAHRNHGDEPSHLDLSLRLSRTPFRPLYSRNVSPDRELAAMTRPG
ncbi:MULTISPECIES: hypothetical protein [Actinoplanes]|uniref:DUF6933 domain-containing protein n=1 Tax=Actinoplanes TaxID=1865 RepID=UPI0005F2E5A9|nr:MULTISPECIES: hypothetical protein [Actinoplanes]GLY01577.1 hypothetical protein Acsp01_19560 [Actinoplanes sp. NBRC 101535]